MDLETTSISPLLAEIIEGYFVILDDNNSVVDQYYMKSKPRFWSDDAYQIHKISKRKAQTFPPIATAFSDLLAWLGNYDVSSWICFANTNTELGFNYYDITILKNTMHMLYNYDSELVNKTFKGEYISVHTMAKEAHSKKILALPRRKSTNRVDFSQEAIYKSLFDGTYNAHRAKDDVMALLKIYKYLERELSNENRTMLSF